MAATARNTGVKPIVKTGVGTTILAPNVGQSSSSGSGSVARTTIMQPPDAPANHPSSTAGATPVQAASGNNQSGFSQLVSKLTAYVAPVTGDTVHFGQYGAAGNYVYIGPDGQPYQGTLSDFYFSNNGKDVNPIIGKAQAVTFAALGIAAPTVVTESTYTGEGGPGTPAAASNDAAYNGLLAADNNSGGATLVVGPGAVSNKPQGTYTEVNGTAALTGALPPSNTTATSPPAAVVPSGTGSTASNVNTPVSSPSSGVNAVTGTSTGSQSDSAGNGATAIANPQDAAAALLSAGLGSGSSGDTGTSVPGSGSIASDLPVATTSDTTTSSGPSTSTILILAVLAVAAIGVYLWYRSKHKKGGHSAHPL